MPIENLRNLEQGKSSDQANLKDLLVELNRLVPGFVSSPVFKRNIHRKSDERHYTQILITYLGNEQKGNMFAFIKEASLPQKRSIDIAVALASDKDREHYIFNIEAKFLPPKDYLSETNTSAIKRFKCGQHGVNNANPTKANLLPENAIVAYSKSGTFDEHLTKINNKISKLAAKATPDKFGLTWYESEQLQKIHINTTAKLKSTHPRVDGSKVVLHHFWVNV